MASPMIGRGRESDVLRLLAPYRDGQPVADGVVIGNVAISGEAVDIELRDASGAAAHAVLRPIEAPSNSFAVELPATQGPLRHAAELVAAAVAKNDDGRFFADSQPLAGAPTRQDTVASAAAPPDASTVAENAVPESGALAHATAALWIVLAASMLAKAWRRPRSWSAGVFGAVILVLAAAARRSVPFTPLHADDHAYLEMAVGLGLPDAESRAQRLMHDYGPSWWQLQRWTAPLWGSDHEALGRWAAAVGALATVLAVLAARRASGKWMAALAGGAAMCWAPVAVRVGHSESTLVVAQLLVAAALWLASPPYSAGSGRWDAVGVVAAICLLATGHPLGPAFAVGAGLCAWALSVRPRADVAMAAAPDAGLPLLEAPAGNAAPRRRWSWLPAPHNLLVLALGGAALATAVGWHWSHQAGLLGGRLAKTGALPIPGSFWLYELWWNGRWAPVTTTTTVALAGFGGFFAQRRVHGTAVGLWSALALALGAAAMAADGLLVVACTTDAVRYQAPLAAVVVLLAAFAPRFADLAGERSRPVVALVVAIALAFGAAQCFFAPAGLSELDAQGQAYAVLKRELARESGDLWLLVPDRPPGEKRHVVVDMPSGQLWRNGPIAHRISADEYVQRCKMAKAPQPAWVFVSPACEAVDLPGVASPCAAIANLIDANVPVRSGLIQPLSGDMAHGLPGEFHSYRGDSVAWRLGRAACPK